MKAGLEKMSLVKIERFRAEAYAANLEEIAETLANQARVLKDVGLIDLGESILAQSAALIGAIEQLRVLDL